MKVEIIAVNVEFKDHKKWDYSPLNCPQCEYPFVHPIAVSIHRGSDRTIINSEAITISKEENKKRGVVISVEYACEANHHGELIFEFHKGQTITSHKGLEPFENRQEWNTIWRN